MNYLVSERVVVPSTEGCCKAGGSEHHADDQGELHICDSSEVELFLNDCTEYVCAWKDYEEHSRSIALYISLHARLLPPLCSREDQKTLHGIRSKAGSNQLLTSW